MGGAISSLNPVADVSAIYPPPLVEICSGYICDEYIGVSSKTFHLGHFQDFLSGSPRIFFCYLEDFLFGSREILFFLFYLVCLGELLLAMNLIRYYPILPLLTSSAIVLEHLFS